MQTENNLTANVSLTGYLSLFCIYQAFKKKKKQLDN